MVRLVLLGLLTSQLVPSIRAQGNGRFVLMNATVAPSFKPANLGNTNRFALADVNIKPLAGTVANSRFALAATISRIYSNPNYPAGTLTSAVNAGLPSSYIQVNWLEDDLNNGYRLLAATNLIGGWLGFQSSVSGNLHGASFSKTTVTASKSQFFKLTKP